VRRQCSTCQSKDRVFTRAFLEARRRVLNIRPVAADRGAECAHASRVKSAPAGRSRLILGAAPRSAATGGARGRVRGVGGGYIVGRRLASCFCFTDSLTVCCQWPSGQSRFDSWRHTSVGADWWRRKSSGGSAAVYIGPPPRFFFFFSRVCCNWRCCSCVCFVCGAGSFV
jgi:hypothetical protein